MYRIALGLVFYLAVFADAAFQNCGSTVGNWISVIVSNCGADLPLCIMNKDKVVSIQIRFNVDKDVNEVKTGIYLRTIGFKIPLLPLGENSHEASRFRYPLTKDGSPYEYHYHWTVLFGRDYPKQKVDVQWELRNEQNEMIACVLIPSKIE